MQLIIFICYCTVIGIGLVVCPNPFHAFLFMIPLGIVDIGSHMRGVYLAERTIEERILSTVRKNRKVESAARNVLRNPNSSKSAKTKAGSALSQPRRTGK